MASPFQHCVTLQHEPFPRNDSLSSGSDWVGLGVQHLAIDDRPASLLPAPFFQTSLFKRKTHLCSPPPRHCGMANVAGRHHRIQMAVYCQKYGTGAEYGGAGGYTLDSQAVHGSAAA